MHLKGHFQNAYITHDIEKAIAIVDRHYGKLDYIRIDPDMVLQTPQGEKASSVRVALGWIDTLQIELIQPVSGFVDHYSHVLPADKSNARLNFHHICVRREDLDAMQAEIDALGMPRAFEAGYPGGHFVYVDARETLGHYLEYAWATPESWAWQGWPEGRPI